jgi:CheY-like chemotaxis protein
LRLALEWSGHSVLEAGDGGEGLQTASENHVDLVVTDLIMPGIDGIELIVQLLEHHPGVPILSMSGWGDPFAPSDQLLSDARKLGVVSYISKPFEMSDFLSAVDAALASGGKT